MKKDNRAKILVVDDDKYSLYILKEMLSEDYDTVLAADGASALLIASKSAFDLVIQDIMLGDMDGLDLCRRLRNISGPAPVKIMLISARGGVEDRLKGYEAGADDYLVKPFERDELLAKVRVFLRLKHVEEVEHLKRDIINLFSHESRTPLNSIVGFAEILESSGNLDKRQKELLAHIIINARDMLSLAEKSIFLNMLSDGAGPAIRKSEASLVLMAEEAAKTRKLALMHKRIRLFKDFSEDILLLCDKALVVEAMGCIIDNAINLSHPGSSLSIFTAREGDNAVFGIKGGEGLAAASKRGDFSLQDINYHGRGTGIGMKFAVCVAELHRGSLTFPDFEKKGNAVEFKLPLNSRVPG